MWARLISQEAWSTVGGLQPGARAVLQIDCWLTGGGGMRNIQFLKLSARVLIITGAAAFVCEAFPNAIEHALLAIAGVLCIYLGCERLELVDKLVEATKLAGKGHGVYRSMGAPHEVYEAAVDIVRDCENGDHIKATDLLPTEKG